MNAKATNNIIKKDEELQRLMQQAVQYAISTGYSKTDTSKIFNDTWSDIWYEEYYAQLSKENLPKTISEEEQAFREKAQQFLEDNQKAFYKIKENKDYYVDLFWIMKTLLYRKGIVMLKDLKIEYVRMGYTKCYSSVVPKDIYEELYLNFRQNLYIGENGKIIQGKADEEWGREIDRNKDYIKWIKKYNYSPSKINNLALMAVWCVMVY